VERAEHLLDLVDAGVEVFVRRTRKVLQVQREKQVVLRLRSRAGRDREESRELALAVAPAALCDVGRNGRCRAA
jgi:hypothetical protein